MLISVFIYLLLSSFLSPVYSIQGWATAAEGPQMAKGPLMWSQEPTTVPDPESDESRPHPNTLFVEDPT
jgi:hypothetical protein